VSRSRRQKKLRKRTRSIPGVEKPVDLFGLEREARIIKSGVREVFTPHKPISKVDLLFGRQDEVRKLVETLNTPGQHVLLYGERGVGKSSLSNIVAEVLWVAVTPKQFAKSCDQSDTFETIMLEPLREVGADLTLTEMTERSSNARQTGFKLNAFDIAKERNRELVATYKTVGSLSPSSVAVAIRDLRGFLVIDEADAITDPNDRRKIAELIKHLSDSGSPFKLMVVGIAETGSELTAAHPSVQRCLKETKLARMTDTELRQIVVSGAEKLKLKFTQPVINSIVRLSAGYPHFTHLLALKCAEEAINERRKEIQPHHLIDALKLATADAEGTLKRIYDDATRSHVSTAYRDILMAAASLSTEEFSASDLRGAYERTTGHSITQGSLNNYFTRLISKDESAILRRTAQGVYRFQDPRMSSYIRIVNQMV
jgi:Archaeal ATPase.